MSVDAEEVVSGQRLDRPRVVFRCRLCGARAQFAWHEALTTGRSAYGAPATTILVPEPHHCAPSVDPPDPRP